MKAAANREFVTKIGYPDQYWLLLIQFNSLMDEENKNMEKDPGAYISGLRL
jgi:hypothetical protein